MLDDSNRQRQRQNRTSEETESANANGEPIYSDYGSEHDLEELE